MFLLGIKFLFIKYIIHMGIFNMVGGGGNNGDPGLRATQGPAPYGFHVPLTTEWQGLKTIMNGLSLTTGDSWRINLHMPFAGYRGSSTAAPSSQGSIGFYWSSSPYGSGQPSYARYLYLYSSNTLADDSTRRAYGSSVRCFKNSPISPLNDSNREKTYSGSGNAGIYYNKVLGIISISGDGINWITIQDKNLGATTVYNNGDTLSEANCGKYFQWGNNYGFSWTGTVTTSSTQVNAQNYGPGNYYNSSTFITVTGNNDWSSVHNDNLRGGVDGNVPV